MIASGPAAEDPVTREQAKAVAAKYGVDMDEAVRECLDLETPKKLTNVHTQIIGSVRELCAAAEQEAAALGYETVFLTDHLNCEARDAGRYLAQELLKRKESNRKIAVIAGGETVVHLTGTGLGGRNQELALAAAELLAGTANGALISAGSDGTDGPTDVAGGYVDADTLADLEKAGMDYNFMLRNNDSYHALQAVGGLVITGPTGTNVNDVAVALLG